MFISYIWLTTDKTPHVELSVLHGEYNEMQESGSRISQLTRELIYIRLVWEYETELEADYGADLNQLKTELLELDKNETTYEAVIYEEDLNSSLKTFHRFWIVQLVEDDINGFKLLVHDINTTFPIHIYRKKTQKWATIKTEVLDNRTKDWVYINEKKKYVCSPIF
jgi:hypothetical protein